MKEDKEVTLFKVRGGHCNVVTKFGTFPFVAGRFFTTDPVIEEKMKALAEKGEHGLYIDTKDAKVDPSAATPADVLRKRIIEEFLAEQRKLAPMGSTHADPAAIQAAMSSTASSPAHGNSLAAQVSEVNKPEGGNGTTLDALNKLAGKS